MIIIDHVNLIKEYPDGMDDIRQELMDNFSQFLSKRRYDERHGKGAYKAKEKKEKRTKLLKEIKNGNLSNG